MKNTFNFFLFLLCLSSNFSFTGVIAQNYPTMDPANKKSRPINLKYFYSVIDQLKQPVEPEIYLYLAEDFISNIEVVIKNFNKNDLNFFHDLLHEYGCKVLNEKVNKADVIALFEKIVHRIIIVNSHQKIVNINNSFTTPGSPSSSSSCGLTDGDGNDNDSDMDLEVCSIFS